MPKIHVIFHKFTASIPDSYLTVKYSVMDIGKLP